MSVHLQLLRTSAFCRSSTRQFSQMSMTIYFFVLVIATTSFVVGQPVDLNHLPAEIPVEVQMPQDQVVYDQRQNGTENLRVQLSGLTVVLAPAEALLSLAPQDLLDTGSAKPKSAHSPTSRNRLVNLLFGFLGRSRH